MISAGVIAALCALVGWGVGDYLIQKLVRTIGNVRTLFYGGFFGAVVMLPFAWSHLPTFMAGGWKPALLVGAMSAIVFSYAFFNFEALRKGKIAVIAPVLALELPLTVLLAVTLAGDALTTWQLIVMMIIFCGFYYVIHRKESDGEWKEIAFERGVALALVGVLGLALYNFSVGIASRSLSPVLIVWLISVVVTMLSLATMAIRRELTPAFLIEPLRKQAPLIFVECICVVGAGVAFAYATSQMPISIATAISEGYVALSVILGLALNHEKLRRSQMYGVVVTIAGILILALLTS